MLKSDTIQPSNHRSTTIKRPLPTQQNDPLKCPRCDSKNTKFCYYNNYNKTQPRHYCKTCKRHWTKGGTLRNVPVGGGRKYKRIKRSNSATTTTTTTTGTNNNLDHNLGFSDPKYIFPNDKGSFLEPNESEFDQVSWDFNSMTQLCPQNLGFSIYSNLSSMDTNTVSIIPASFSPLLTGFKDDSDIATTRMMMPNSINVLQPWMQVPTTSNILEENYWTWNDIDSVVQTVLNKSYEDPQMKP